MSRRRRCKGPDPTAVASLARISDKEKQGQASLDVQCTEARERLVERRGWHVVAEYRVKHRGSDLSRDPVYTGMIEDARAGNFAKLCLHKFDRFARRAYDREVFGHVLTRECGVELHAALEPYDLATRAGQLTKKTTAFIFDVFLDSPREESLKGMRQKVQAGGWVARAPVGCVNRREEIAHNKFRRWVEVDPVLGPIVARAFKAFAGEQHTIDTLTDWLNEQGHTWSKGRPWRRDRVHRMLLDPFYTGKVSWNGIEADGVHQPIVDPATWERCRAILRAHGRSRERTSRHVYPLVGGLRFAELGCRAHAEHQAHVGESYYRSRVPGPDSS